MQWITHDVAGVELEVFGIVGRRRKYYSRIQRIQSARGAVGHKVDVGKFFRLALRSRTAGTAADCVITVWVSGGKCFSMPRISAKAFTRLSYPVPAAVGLPINSSFFVLSAEDLRSTPDEHAN